jgi:putative thiamine transport system ATP-binding protein
VSIAITLENVSIRLKDAVLVPPLSATVAPGEVLTVMGPSGSGKSTLLAFIGGFLDPVFEAKGQVLLGDRDVTALPAEARGIGILFQDDLLFPHLSVGSNLAFGLSPAVRGRSLRRERVAAALASAGLAGFEDRDPATLSGGQRARASLMRSLLAEPKALLLDEPFSKLDQALREEFRAFLFAYLADRQLPMILVTHDPADAQAAGGRVIDLGAEPSSFVAGAAP